MIAHAVPDVHVRVHVGNLDQKKHDGDVLEHVLRGVRAVIADEQRRDRPVSVDLRARPWLGGVVVGAVRVSVADDEPDEGGRS